MKINRYVLDTNVLISAVLFPDSVANQAYQQALDTGILLASQETFAEYERVMLRPKFDRYVSLANRQVFLSELRSASEMVSIVQVITDCRDIKDNMYLEVSINGLADVLVTGDQDLLILHPFRQILPILNPSDFLKHY